MNRVTNFIEKELDRDDLALRLAIAVIILWSGCIVLFLLIFQTLQDRGQFGDQFGAVNALFAGFAFVGLIATLQFQRRESRSQRIELEGTQRILTELRIANERSAEQFVIQNTSLKKQIFEATFFEALSEFCVGSCAIGEDGGGSDLT
jgi:hypothetical protein